MLEVFFEDWVFISFVGLSALICSTGSREIVMYYMYVMTFGWYLDDLYYYKQTYVFGENSVIDIPLLFYNWKILWVWTLLLILLLVLHILKEQVLYGYKMWHPFWCWKILIYSDLSCQLNWEKGCYISGIRAGLSVCWSVRLVCRVVVSVIVWQLNTVKVVCSLVRDRCVKHYQCFLVFLILCLQDLEWDKWGRSWYFSKLLQDGALAQCVVDCKIVSIVWTVLFPIPEGMRR